MALRLKKIAVRVAVMCTLLFSSFLACQAQGAWSLQPGDQQRTIQTSGGERSYVLHLPPGLRRAALVPLVIALHGGGGNAQGIMGTSLLSEKADREGFIVVYPNGTGYPLVGRERRTWNAGDCCGIAVEKNIDDVGFIRTLLSTLSTRLPINTSRVFVTGFSNGGSMTYRLACEMADRIAAIAVVSSTLAVACAPSTPMPVVIYHGTLDTHVPYDGGYSSTTDTYKKSVAEVVEFWVQHNRTATTPSTDEQGAVRTDTYASGRRGSEVILYTLDGGGHAWPGGVIAKGADADEPFMEISATETMWEFFVRHPKGAR